MDKFVRVSDVIDWFRVYGHMDEKIPFDVLITDLKYSVPAADVAPVVHGKWIKWYGDNQHHCTVCECYANAKIGALGYVEEEFLSEYCPNCGAKMDGGTTP